MLNRRASLNNSAAKITSVTLESNNLVTYTTEDAHGLFVGAIASVTGVSATSIAGATQPNPTVSNVYRIDNPKSFTIYVSTPYTATSFPATASSSGTVQVAQGSLNSVHLAYAQPVKVVRPTFFNFITPTINAIASGNRVLLSWDASGVAYPTPTVTVGRYDSTGTTLLGSVSTAAAGSSVIDPSGENLTNGTEFVYIVTAANTSSTISASTSVTSLFIDTPSNISALATRATANSITVSWTAPVTNAVLTSYTVQRSTNGGAFATTYATTSGSVTSFTDTGLTETSTYRYRVLASADYTSSGTGIIVSGVSATSASTAPYFISTVTPTATVTASTANSITVTWSAPVTSNPQPPGYSLHRSSNGGATWSANLLGSITSSATTYVDSTASSGLTFTYRLAAINAQLASAYTSSGTATAYFLSDPLGAPTVTRTSTATTSLTVTGSFTANPTISGYNIQRALTSSPTVFTNIGSTTFANSTTTGNVLSYTDTTVQPNTSYLYQIKAKNAELTTANWSASSASVLTYAVPFGPTSVSASSVNASSVTVTWSGASVNSANTPITNYVIEYKLSSTTTYTTITGVSDGSSSYTVSGLTTDSAYDFRVLAVNSIGTSSIASAIVRTATPVRVSDPAVYLTAYAGSTPYFNTTQTFLAYAASGVNRSAKLQISTTGNSGWTDVTSFTITGYAPLDWLANTTDVRYFRLFVSQDSIYTESISNTVTIDPINNSLNVSLYSASLTDGATYNSETLTNSTRGVTITVTDLYGTPVPSATVTWYKAQYQNTSYANINSGTTDSNGRATLNITNEVNAGIITGTTSLEINATVSKSGYTTAPIDSWYYTLFIRETESVYANISRSYAGSNAARTDSGTDMYYGYYSTTHNTQKSAMGFTANIDWAKLDASNEVISATLRLTRIAGSGSTTSTVFIGTHENPSGSSASWDTYGESAFGTITARAMSTTMTVETKTITLSESVKNLVYEGGVRGFTIGPPTSTNISFYGRLQGAGASSSVRPLFSTVYTVIPTFRIT